ncbi:DUF6881 domain-containing protein [Roseibium sp.]|uniref:DUF6881 domain-containing protein n=1 Tax=Roseibium sp. TaxID=1936156 RepID=UPI003BB1C801
MRYLKVLWIEAAPTEPSFFYWACGPDGWAQRSIEIYCDGSFRLASRETRRNDGELPQAPVTEGLEQARESKEFRIQDIEADEFERIWQKLMDREQ